MVIFLINKIFNIFGDIFTQYEYRNGFAIYIIAHKLKKSRISMKIDLLIGILFCSIIFSCGNKNEEKFIFFLHSRFLETHHLNELHPEFGRTEYREIIKEFKNSGFTVISE